MTYISEKYEAINTDLREGDISAENRETIKQLDAALAKSQLTKDTKLYEDQRLYRAASVPEVNAALKSGNLKGLEFTEKGFTSTTSDKETARSFQRGEESRLFVVNAPKGTKAGKPGELAGILKGEKEVLLARNTRYRVKNVEKVKEKRTWKDSLTGRKRTKTETVEYIHLDVIGQG